MPELVLPASRISDAAIRNVITTQTEMWRGRFYHCQFGIHAVNALRERDALPFINGYESSGVLREGTIPFYTASVGGMDSLCSLFIVSESTVSVFPPSSASLPRLLNVGVCASVCLCVCRCLCVYVCVCVCSCVIQFSIRVIFDNDKALKTRWTTHGN